MDSGERRNRLMDAATWQRAKEWLLEAAKLPDSARAAFLTERCPDETLRRELLEMLTSDATLSGIVSGTTLPRGTRLGPYEIDTVIGAGGMGEVYRARDGRLGRDVAIKVIPAPFADDRDRLARFEREAKLLASLNHPHICTLHDIGRESGTDFIVMEYVDGDLLSDRLRKGPLPVDKALAYAIEIADALDKAHAVGIVHRDLKPGNVMLTKSGTKLLDFGLARSTRAPRDVTKTGTILGTLRYMSPEQLKGAEADARSDVWAFGCVLYQMLTGRAPFDSPSEAAVGAAILETEPPPVSTVVRGEPPALQRVVDRCLAKAPDDRWQSAADLRHELDWLARGGGKSGDAPRTRGVPSRRQRIAWSVAGMTVVLAVAAASLVVWNARHAAPPAATHWSIVMPDGIVHAGSFALSRDGLQLAFIGHPRDRSASPQIWLRSLVGDDVARPLTGTAGSHLPFWSPDGRSLGFFADGKLKSIDVASGMIRVLCSAPMPRGGAWGEHTILFVPEQHSGLYRVPDDGSGQATPVTQPQQKDELHRFPSFLADGVHFVFTVLNNDVVSIEIGSLGDSRITELHRQTSGGHLGRGMTQAYVARGMLVYASGGSVLAQPLDEKRRQLSGVPMLLAKDVDVDEVTTSAFAVSDSTFVYQRLIRPVSQLTWLSRSGDVEARIWEPGWFQSVQLSPDDTQAVAARSDGMRLVLWVIDLARGVPLQLTVESGPLVLWSSDGARVLFRKPDALWHDHIHSILVDGRGGEKLETDQPNSWADPLGWSDTGSLLCTGYTISGKSLFDLWECPSSGDAHILIPAENENGGFYGAAVTRKGDLIASVAGGTALYVQPIRGRSARVLVDRGNVASPRWRADGRELYYLSKGHLMAADISGVDPVVAGPPRTLLEFRGSFFSPSRDGRRFLAAVPQDSGESNAADIILNWTSLPRK
jgi:eukaryotic-like serine/threonine-protein kinase